MDNSARESTGLRREERFFLEALFRLYPRAFREEIWDEWLDFLEEQRRERRYQRPVWGALRFWMDVLMDLARSIPLARREARGNEKGNGRGRKGAPAPDSLLRDLRFAYRTLSRRPLFAGVAIVTLGLGIGSATAMFSVVDAVLLADRQYTEPDRLFSVLRQSGCRWPGKAAFTLRMK